MKGKIIVLLVGMALLVGMLSGCTEEPEPTANTAPEASFTFVVDGATKTVTFTDASLDADGDELTHTWDFGDGNTGEGLTPTNVYAENGTYEVTLTVSDGTDTGTTTGTVEINVPTGPTAGFTYEPVDVVNNTQVNFTDASTAGDVNISTYFWDFGDGTNSSLQNPTHTYTATGDVTVTLTVTDESALTDTTTQTITVAEEVTT